MSKTIKDKKFFIPYHVTTNDFATMHITINDVVPYRIGGRHIMVYMAENYDPELYEIMKKDFQNQLKAEWREKCCYLSDGKGGFFKCCGPCGNCNHPKENAKRSLEAEFENNGFEPESNYSDVCTLDDRITLEMLMEKLHRLDPNVLTYLNFFSKVLPKGTLLMFLTGPEAMFITSAKKGLSKLKKWYEE